MVRRFFFVVLFRLTISQKLSEPQKRANSPQVLPDGSASQAVGSFNPIGKEPADMSPKPIMVDKKGIANNWKLTMAPTSFLDIRG
jgi:hypothetical protein